MDTTTGTAPVAEIVTFRLNATATPDAFLRAARGTGDALRAAPGFLRRRLTLGADGVWTDWVEWRDAATARAAANAVMQDPAFAPFMAMIDGATVTMRHDAICLMAD